MTSVLGATSLLAVVSGYEVPVVALAVLALTALVVSACWGVVTRLVRGAAGPLPSGRRRRRGGRSPGGS